MKMFKIFYTILKWTTGVFIGLFFSILILTRSILTVLSSFFSKNEWRWIFKEFDYKGDYEFIYFK